MYSARVGATEIVVAKRLNDLKAHFALRDQARDQARVIGGLGVLGYRLPIA